MTKKTILPCPFCGSKPSLLKGKRYKSDGATAKYILGHRPGDWIWRPQIGCKKCRINRVGDDENELVAWWNMRHKPSQSGKGTMRDDRCEACESLWADIVPTTGHTCKTGQHVGQTMRINLRTGKHTLKLDMPSKLCHSCKNPIANDATSCEECGASDFDI